MPDHSVPWTEANLLAIDLEGSGPQDPAGEAMLEIALVPIRNGTPEVGNAFSVRVDWRLLHTVVPLVAPIHLIDTLRLAKHLHPELANGHGLQAWIERLGLSDDITHAAPDSQPHRALWDTIGTATLLAALTHDTPLAHATLAALLAVGGLNLDGSPISATHDDQPTLWDSL